MTVEYGKKVKPEKGAKLLNGLVADLLPGEQPLFLTKGLQLRPTPADHLLVTTHRVVGVHAGKVKAEFSYSQPLTLTCDPSRQEVTVSGPHGSYVFRAVTKDDHERLSAVVAHAQATTDPDAIRAATMERDFAPGALVDRAKVRNWPNTRVVGSRLSSKASQAVARLCEGEDPWFVLVSSGASGVLAAWDDRLAIVKTGALTSFMAGSLGGERSAVFHFTDITGIEYNSGIMNGVLEILTPSYSGGGNKDFWRGSTRSANADSNNPFTLSNTLPLAKSEYRDAAEPLGELRRRISAAKQRPTSAPAPAPAGSSLAEELIKLAGLRDAGVLTEEEFAAAKARLLS